MTNFSKTDLVKELAHLTGMTVKAAGEAVDALTAIIRSETGDGKTVSIPGFGKFEMKERAARTGRNPATGAEIEIAASRKLAFKAFKTSS